MHWTSLTQKQCLFASLGHHLLAEPLPISFASVIINTNPALCYFGKLCLFSQMYILRSNGNGTWCYQCDLLHQWVHDSHQKEISIEEDASASCDFRDRAMTASAAVSRINSPNQPPSSHLNSPPPISFKSFLKGKLSPSPPDTLFLPPKTCHKIPLSLSTAGVKSLRCVLPKKVAMRSALTRRQP